MNINRVLFFCFLSALCGRDSGLVSARLNIYTGPQGDTGSISCYLSPTGSKKFFCKNECKGEDILIRTDEVRAESGRYSIEYKDGSSGRGILSVTITNMTKSDSGTYTCGFGKDLVPESYSTYEIRVLDAPLVDGDSGLTRTDIEGENITVGCSDLNYGQRKFLCRGECKKEEDIIIETDQNNAQSGRYSLEYREGSHFGLYVTVTRATKSDSGWYRCGYGRALSPDSDKKIVFAVTDASTLTDQFTASSPTTTTQSLSPSSESLPETTTQPAAAAPTTPQPIRTLPPLSSSVPSASTPPPTTPPPPAATPPPPAAATTHTLSSSSGRLTPSPALPESNRQPAGAACSNVAQPGYFTPLVGCASLVGVLLLAVLLLLLYIKKTKRRYTLDNSNMELQTNLAVASTCEDSA